ncbi:MAG: carbonic anhydrase [Alphaproteobacteria bacterium]|nr:carbonic anhydrase [Alphaproteobacteria bacterium]
MSNAATIIADLAAGNRRFLDGQSLTRSQDSLEKLKTYARVGQTPKAVILCCSDSRAPVEMIFDQDIGDLFVIRVAGNIIAPSLVGSVEFAAETFGTRLVLVMGHSQCGAVGATLDHIEHAEIPRSENIHDIVSRIKPHIFAIAAIKDIPRGEKMNRAVEANVRASVGQLAHASRMIESLTMQGKIEIRGAVLDLSTGRVVFLDP